MVQLGAELYSSVFSYAVNSLKRRDLLTRLDLFLPRASQLCLTIGC